MNAPADQCPRCAMLRGEVADWRRLYQGLARSIATPNANARSPARERALKDNNKGRANVCTK